MENWNWPEWVLSIATLIAGGGWFVNRRKYRQEIKENEMNLSKMYVDEFKQNIAEPLRREVGGLRREIKHLRDAIQKINDCPHAAGCPVYSELQKQQADVGAMADGEDC